MNEINQMLGDMRAPQLRCASTWGWRIPMLPYGVWP